MPRRRDETTDEIIILPATDEPEDAVETALNLLPGTVVSARGLRWEVVTSQNLGPPDPIASSWHRKRGIPAVAVTIRPVKIPEQFFFYRVRDNLIVEIRPEPIAGGAPQGILEQIGVKWPAT